VKGLEVLFEGEAGLVHAELKGGQILPIQLVGDGCHVLLSICLAIWASRNGIVLVDEFDASIHYSKLVEVWKVIIDYARANNCQVFIATHSRECIEAAAQALNQSTSKGFRYFRVESSNGTSRAIKYDGKEISVAMDQEWEVR
jgi:AAA15 family ATPase/GTPase